MRRPMSRRAVLRTTAVALGVGGSGCLFGAEEATPTGTASPSPTPTATPTPTPTPTPPASVPATSFAFDYFEEGGRLVVTHTGGTALDAGNTGSVTVRSSGTILERWARPVTRDDSLTVAPDGGFDEGERIRVVWTSPMGGGSATLVDFSVPSASRQTPIETAPQPSFSWQYDAVEDVLSVTYRVGRRLSRRNTGEVFVLVGTSRRESWPLPVDGGETLRVAGAGRDRTATVYWVSPDGSRRVELGSYRTPDR